jgi:hypothetical protein
LLRILAVPAVGDASTKVEWMPVQGWDGETLPRRGAGFRGHAIRWDPSREIFVYADDGSPAPQYGGEERPCTHCGLLPTVEGFDACLGRIPGAVAACCGHGVAPGYVMFPRGAQEDPGPWRRARASLSILSPEEVSGLRR